MASITSYQISVPEHRIQQLKQKLELVSLPDELEDAQWDYGAPLADIKRLTAYWRDGFDWRKQEEKLNELPQFQTSVEVDAFGSLDIHFVHQQSAVKSAIPLLFIHGWPGGFFEASKLLPLLTRGGADAPAFHVVAPSLPNFGFSEGVQKKGFNLVQYAEVCHKLMQRLGYREYVIQGGDWGSTISTVLRHKYSAACKASHINMVFSVPPAFSKQPLLALQHAVTPFSDGDKQGLKKTKHVQEEMMGYMQQQSTKPQTLGYALADSPVGLLAWIYEKLHDWTDGYPFTDDEILTWISVYQFSRAGPAASLRIYYEVRHDPDWGFKGMQSKGPAPASVLLGISYMPKELTQLPRLWSHSLGNLVFESEHAEGGHFGAFEKPELIARDLRAMFGKKGAAYAAVKGSDGYDKGEQARL